MSRDKCWHDIMKESLSTTTNFKLVHQLQFIKHRYLRPSRILLHSLEGFGIISSTHVELERLKIRLAHAQFSQSTTWYVGLRYTCDITSQAPPLFSCMLKRSGSLGTRLDIPRVHLLVKYVHRVLPNKFCPTFSMPPPTSLTHSSCLLTQVHPD